ncbi:uncharacterized protein [Dermacentor albipictus]|uniref:uncharacterized protein isoform X1 n=1 Tax=Dermacentor albipictus TaxID=60249 RepID=UPI0031FCD435
MWAHGASSIVCVGVLFACSAAAASSVLPAWPLDELSPQHRTAQPEGRVFSSLLRVFEAAEWDKVFVKMARVVVNYFTDMAFKVLFGSTGSRRSSDGSLKLLRAGRQRRDMAQYVLERQQEVSQLPPDCQRRIACRVGQHLGSVNSLRTLAPMLRTVDRSLVEAALHGVRQSDCDMAYPDCQLA